MKTIVFGNLTPMYDKLLEGAARGLGYRISCLPNPDNVSLAVGKEYCDKGMCNPTYYTVGNLIKFLKQKYREGIDVEKDYGFVTVGACGPCRFGMYEMQFRQALKSAGFPNLEISILNQDNLSSEGLVKLTPKLVWNLAKAVWIGDILRDISCQIRPYEVNKGETDKVVSNIVDEVYGILEENASVKRLWKSLRRGKEKIERIKLDYSKPKPIVSVIGEFWSHTTESDGNYNVHRWLEDEGAEVKPETIAEWIDYQFFMESQKTKLEMKAKGFTLNRVKRLAAIEALAKTFRGLYNVFRSALSFKPRPLPSQKLLAEISKPYFHYFVVGGEGHLEVAKHIHNVKFRKSHMTLSAKPFGCMPSTISDGVQVKVVSDYPDSIFTSIETSGDGEVNVKSRIQMKLFEAKRLAEKEFNEACSRFGINQNDLTLASNKGISNPFSPLSNAYIGTSARFIAGNLKRLKEIKLHGFPLHSKVQA